MRLTQFITLVIAVMAPVFLGGCGSVRSHWGIEGDYELPIYDNYYNGGGKHKPKKKKHHKKPRHHDDDSDTGVSPYASEFDIPI
ncbi:MAG: hypothetical protein NC411_01760 [Bacteroides sp.]|nr:hypothetical protein [Bacteroides sp.]